MESKLRGNHSGWASLLWSMNAEWLFDDFGQRRHLYTFSGDFFTLIDSGDKSLRLI